jgi:hypothetical protein
MKNISVSLVRLHLVVAFGAALLAVTSAQAETPARAETPVLSVAQVVAKNVAARGGLAAWQKIHTLAFVGKMDAGRTHPAGMAEGTANPPPRRRPGEKPTPAKSQAEAAAVIALPFRLEMKRPRKTRLELDFQGQTAVQVYDGELGWKLRPFLGRTTPERFTADELKIAADQQDLDGLLIDAAAKGTKIAMEAMDPVEGHRAYKLKVSLKNGDVRSVWVDADSFLELKVDGRRQVGGHPRGMYTLFRDYRRVEGVMIPFTMETVGQGLKTSEKIVVEKVTVNTDLPDARFVKPEESHPG